MSKDVRIFDRDELKEIYQELNPIRIWLEQIDLNSDDRIVKKYNPEYLSDAIKLIKKVRDKF